MLRLVGVADAAHGRLQTDVGKALGGHYQDKHVFELRQAVALYDFYQSKR